MIDQHYTSNELAHTMVESLPANFCPSSVADFAAGEGSLLAAALVKWPNLKVIANDLSPANARELRGKYPNGLISTANFLRERSVRSSKFSALAGKVDLILINPPFSQRGIPPADLEILGQRYRVGVAVAFLYRALQFISENGLLMAILPDGCLAGERDAAAWQAIRNQFRVDIIRDNARSAFSGVRARTSLVRISRAESCSKSPSILTTTLDGKEIKLKRGRCQMHTVSDHRSAGGVPLVHTTDLENGKVGKRGVLVAGFPKIRGPAILFPRVGRITPGKVTILESGRVVSLSDCVIGLTCSTRKEADKVHARILHNWADFASAYRGTGAPYITVKAAALNLGHLLGSLWSEEDEDNKEIALSVA